jgi:cysteine synthase A
VVREHPVVMFALEWCEFCWAVRKLFARLGVACESVDVDAVRFQQDDMGLRLRAVLRARTGAPTMPQIFVGGQLVGGCTDLFDAMRSGDLQRQLDAAGVAHQPGLALDPYSLLPKWMHPRQAA